MCVRYTLHKTDAALEAVARALGRPLPSAGPGADRHNITLGHVVPVVAGSPAAPALLAMRWGLIPPFGAARALPNARAETAAASPVFRGAVARRRCLVPANGFYEWTRSGGASLPHLFTLEGDEPFAFAGLWEPGAADADGTFAILTTAPSADVSPVHDRMPVILTDASMGPVGGA